MAGISGALSAVCCCCRRTFLHCYPRYTNSWRLVHESLPLKGKQYNDLPAAVLEVSESSLSGMYSVQFMHALGCQIEYRVARRSQVFVCIHEDAEVQVS
jgi:hypothetical protein